MQRAVGLLRLVMDICRESPGYPGSGTGKSALNSWIKSAPGGFTGASTAPGVVQSGRPRRDAALI